jgi:hypothetical protein
MTNAPGLNIYYIKFAMVGNRGGALVPPFPLPPPGLGIEHMDGVLYF